MSQRKWATSTGCVPKPVKKTKTNKNKGSGYRPSSRWSNQRQRRDGGTLVNIGRFTFLFRCFLFVFLCQRSAWSVASRSARGTQAYYGKPVEVHTWVNKIETEALAVPEKRQLTDRTHELLPSGSENCIDRWCWSWCFSLTPREGEITVTRQAGKVIS